MKKYTVSLFNILRHNYFVKFSIPIIEWGVCKDVNEEMMV